MLEEDKPLNKINEEQEIGSNPIPYWVTTEREGSKYNLSRQEILELGFLRSNPTRFIYIHKNQPSLVLEEIFEYNFGVKDFVEEKIEIRLEWPVNITTKITKIIYNSVTPTKQEIEDIIKQFV